VTHSEGKILSIFEPSTEVIRKGKASKPNEFGKMVKIQEAENRIVIAFEVYDKRPSDSDLPIPSLEIHRELMGRTPHLVAGDAGFYSSKNEAKAQEMGVKSVSVPNRSTKSPARRQHQKKGSEREFGETANWRRLERFALHGIRGFRIPTVNGRSEAANF
jgi:IS5 family transposase